MMQTTRRIWLGLLLWAAALAALASPLSQALETGQHVLLMRHADAPGLGDPSGFVPGDCRTQRNLGEAGRAQARAIGYWLRTQGVQAAQLYASPWCRTLETARLLDLGVVRSEDSLASFFSARERSPAQTRQLQRFVAGALQARPGLPLILVTHDVNINAYVGESLASGEMVLVRVDREGQALQHVRHAAPMAR